MSRNIFFRKDLLSFIEISLKERDVILVNAISGSGKTTLFMDFLKKKKSIYFPFVEEDSDPQIFLEKLNEKISSADKLNFPELTADFFPSIDKFLFNYAKNLLNSADIPFLLFDDFQKVKDSRFIKNFIVYLIRGVKGKPKIILLSREEFPFGYFEWDVERKILRLDTTFFRFSKEDIKEFFMKRFKKDLTDEEINRILTSTDGIIGRIILSENKVFNNMYTGISDKLDSLVFEENLRDLVEISEFPYINEKVLSTKKEKDRIKTVLEKLYFERFFVESFKDGYRIHEILRDYLRIKAREKFKNKYETYIRRIGKELYRSGFMDHAINLFSQINDYESIYSILEKEAFDLIYSNKLYSLERYLSFLEGTIYENYPVVLFAKGFLNKFSNPVKSIEFFKRALSVFRDSGDLNGEKLVIGELFDIAQFYGEDFSVGGELLDRAEHLLIQTESYTDVDIRLLSYMGIISLLYEGNSRKSVYYFDIINEILGEHVQDLPIFFSYINLYAAISYDVAGQFDKAKRSFSIANLIFERSNKNPDSVFMFNFLSSIHKLFTGDFHSSIEMAKRAMDLINSWGFLAYEEHILARMIEAYLYLGNTMEAEKLINKIEKGNIYRSTFSAATTKQLEAQLFLMKRNLDIALKKAEESANMFSAINGKAFEQATRGIQALILTEKGNFNRAEDILRSIIRWSEKVGAVLQEFSAKFFLCYLFYKKEDNENLIRCLNDTMKLGKRYQIPIIFNQFPEIMSTVLSLSLKSRVEEDYAKYLIELHNLSPPDNTFDENGWNWKLKIYSFGKFRVLLDNREITDWKGEKTQKLLKTIVALGGEDISVDLIIDVLWDRVDYVKSKQNFEFTLRKLRNVLGDNDKSLVILKNNRVSLNRKYVWTDTWAFDRVYSDIELSLSKSRFNFSTDFNKIKVLYRGDFLEKEDSILFEEVREDYRQKYLSLLEVNTKMLD